MCVYTCLTATQIYAQFFFPRIRSYLRMCMAWVDVFIFSFAIVAVAVSRCRPIQIRNIALVTLRIFTMCPLHVKARTFPCHTHTHTECQPCFSRFIVCSFVVFRMQAQLSYAMKIAMCTWGIFCGYARRVHVTQPFYFGTVMAPLTIVCVCVVSYHSLGNCISEISHHEIKRKVKSHKIRKIKEEKNERIKIE